MTTLETPVRPPLATSAARRIRLLGIIALTALGTCVFGQALREPKPAVIPVTGATHTYEIPLLKDGFAFSQPTNEWSYFFELRPNVVLEGNQFVQLNFVCSPLLKMADGSMTVLLNGTQIATRRLGGNVGGQLIQWHVDMPLKYFKGSTFNQLRLVSHQKTVDGPCKDVDNFGNWVRFAQGCRLHLVRSDPDRYPLNSFPFPYIDTLAVNADGVLHTNWEVPGGAQPAQIAEALGLASDLGATSRFATQGLNIHLTQGAGRGGNTIAIGGATSGSGGGGMLEVVAGGRPGNATLNVGGAGIDAIHMARKALSDDAGMSLARGYSAAIDHLPVEAPRQPTTLLGAFDFAHLGIGPIHLAGAFHQRATIYIQRPIRTDLGRESTISINFKHSASLNPLRSILSVYINGIPIGSARLDGDNANNGHFDARIPVTELAKNLWVVDLEAYHDLAAIDCSKTYDEVAWTVVESSSLFDLRAGTLTGFPYLEAFPYLVGKDGMAPAKVPISLSPNANDAELSLAAIIAARAGQVNRQSFDWDVILGGPPSSKTSAIMIGTFDETSRFQPLASELAVVPAGGGQVKVSNKVNVQASQLSGGVVVQAIPTPGGDGVTYVILGASDFALQQFANDLADPTKGIKVNGQIAAMGGDGKSIKSYVTEAPGVASENVSVETQRYTPVMLTVMTIILVGLLLLFIWAALQFRRRAGR